MGMGMGMGMGKKEGRRVEDGGGEKCFNVP